MGTPLLIVFSKLHEFVQNSFVRPRSARFNIFALCGPLFSDFSKRHQFVENSVFCLRSARTVIFALGALLFNSFQQSARVCPKSETALLARDQHVLSFSHCAHHLLAIVSKVHEFVQNSVFRSRSACFVIFTLGTLLLSVFSKVHEFVQNSVFSGRSARFNIFALGGPLFSNYQQRASVCPKERFQPEISMF